MVWKKLKAHMTKDQRQGSIGYSIAMSDAAQIFVLIMDDLKNPDRQKQEFNDDKEVGPALVVTGHSRQHGISL